MVIFTYANESPNTNVSFTNVFFNDKEFVKMKNDEIND